MLDERGVIHYDSSLTNREHLRHLRDKPQLYHDLLDGSLMLLRKSGTAIYRLTKPIISAFASRLMKLNRMVA